MTDKTFKADADRLFPEGCKCGNNGGGDCDWCLIFNNGTYDPDEDDNGDDPANDYRPGGNFNKIGEL